MVPHDILGRAIEEGDFIISDNKIGIVQHVYINSGSVEIKVWIPNIGNKIKECLYPANEICVIEPNMFKPESNIYHKRILTELGR